MAYFPNIHLVLLLLVALAHQLYGIKVTLETIQGTPAKRIPYHGSSDEYDELVDTFIDSASSGRELYDLPVHPVQAVDGKPPPWWITIDIVGRDKELDRTRLLLRSDNGYLVGFTNCTGHYHLLEGSSQNLITDATVVPFGESYSGLFGPSASEEIPKLPLSKDLFQDGSHTLGTYPVSSLEETREAVGRFVVMICEAARLKPIRELIGENWDVGECRVDKVSKGYTLTWGTMSLSLFCEQHGIALTGSDAKDLRHAGIYTTEKVKSILGIVLVPRRYDPNDPAKSCSPPRSEAQMLKKKQKEKERRKRKKKEKQESRKGQGQGHQGSGSVPL